MSEVAISSYEHELDAGHLKRDIGWAHATWIATGAPALVLFSIGAIAATVGSPSWLVWVISVLIAVLQMFTYAEVVGLFPHRSGGAAIAGAMAWLEYGKPIPAISVWTYWLGWSPVIAIGTGILSGYVLTALFPADSVVNTWQLTLVDLHWIQDGLSLRINSNFLLSVIVVLVSFAIQHGGILQASRAQMIFTVASLLPLGLVGIVPLLTGSAPLSSFTPFVPLAHDAKGAVIPGNWDMAGITLFVGGLFIAAWSTYGLETCLVYVREFKNPAKDTVKTAIATGLICLFFYAIVPISFQAFLGLKGLLEPGIYDGSGVAAAMAKMVGATGMAANVIVAMLVITLLLSVLTAIAGSARTLYQASVDGFLPKYLSKVNMHGTPMKAMWTDLVFNIILLTMSNSVFLLAISNVCYLTFIYLNLQSGWIHRIDRPGVPRPYKAPNWLLAIGAALGFFDMFLIGMGANSYGAGVLKAGLITVFLAVPVFWYRHYVTDKGKFPAALAIDWQPGSASRGFEAKAGILPYLALAGGAAAVALGYYLAVY
ncbi:APC family permease [Hyphomicrobium sp.]|uniref:APC family permease n=1 Tax=Hyphomicrobium sp. TaxID=82 RepID=UPI0025C03407|nr:APC family permease [Hyphomicrobium sp.]